jgi:hypothetical protein
MPDWRWSGRNESQEATVERRTLWSAAAIVTATAGLAVLPAATAQAGVAGVAGRPAAAPVNLIKNHGAEKATPTSSGGTVTVKHWTPARGTSFTAVAYGTRGFPGPHSPGPGHRGHNFFAGGPRGRTSGATQAVKISSYVSLIRSGHAEFTLSGWLGGEGARGDYATLTITWKSAHGQVLGHTTIGPVTERQRHGVSGLQRRTKAGLVPRRTSQATVSLRMVRTRPGYIDGFADNLSLTIVRKA